jgi:hypothetical protein
MILAQVFKTYRGAMQAAAHRQGCNDDAFKRGDAAARHTYRAKAMADGTFRVERTRKQ